ncbi:MAG: CoA transferase [Dehalococcoidia bacterium]|nr:CoA transferase [Dehalococcoidia bacterium]MDW8120095.1 CoA transferase [Chloroflexota bacterium]
MTFDALSDILVVEVGSGVAPAYCGRLLADQGARVLLVEPPEGSPLRREGPFPGDIPHAEKSGLFLYLMAGKESITLNLHTATGRALFLRLLERADVLVEDVPPGHWERWGLAPLALQRAFPRLVHLSLTWFGHRGPYASYQGCDLVAYAVSGYAYMTGDPDKPPLKAGGRQTEYQAGVNGAVAVLSALLGRNHTGRGQWIDLSAIEATAHTFDGVTVYHMAQRGILPLRNGTRLIQRDPHTAYPSTLLPVKGGWVHAHWSPQNPEALALLAHNPRLADPEVMETPMGHADEIDALLIEGLKDRTPYEVMEQAQELRIPFTVVQDVAQALDDPQNAAMGFFPEVEHPVAGRWRIPASPIHWDDAPNRPGRAPLLGEHNRRVFGQELGLAPEDLVRLRAGGVL